MSRRTGGLARVPFVGRDQGASIRLTPCRRAASATGIVLCAWCLAAGAAPKAQRPASVYPDRPIRFIVPFAPGGAGDLVARVVATKLAENLGQSVVVDNRPGAGGNLAAGLAAKAAPDGYTILQANVGPFAINPSLHKSLPFDPVRDFAPVSLLVTFPNVLTVKPAVPARSVKELVALARSAPGKLSFASAGIGTTSHLAVELLCSMAHVRMTHVPYRGGGPALVDLLAGQVDLYFGSVPILLPYAKAGKLRPLAVSSTMRVPAAPELPTMAESGFPDFSADAWNGVVVPARTPARIVERLNAAIVTALEDPAVRASLSAQGADALPMSPARFAAYIASESAKWAKAVRVSGARAED